VVIVTFAASFGVRWPGTALLDRSITLSNRYTKAVPSHRTPKDGMTDAAQVFDVRRSGIPIKN
jgi:hypothetical protein